MAAIDDVERRVNQFIGQLQGDFAHLGEELPWMVVRALIHRAVHLGAEGETVDFCALATYLSEMIGHAHKLAHGEDPQSNSHRDVVH